MEKAEPLAFVKPFEPQVIELFSEEQRQSSVELFSTVCQVLLAKFKEHTRTFEHFSEIGTITTFEIPLIVPFPDSSCVYAIIYGQRRGEDYLNMSITVEECTTDQRIVNGYTYGWDSSGFTRNTNSTDDPDFDNMPFSMIQNLRNTLEVDLAYESDNPEEREEAKVVLTDWEERDVIASYEEEFGYDSQTPDENELYQLADLLFTAIPRIDS